MDTKDKIGIFGGGVEGIAVAKYLKGKGYSDLTIFDEQEKVEVPEGVKTVLGAGAFEKAEGYKTIFRSPGIQPKKCATARAKGAAITSPTQYFFENCPAKIIGVTGTKGKGTTSTLIYLILQEAGRDIYLGGNIGESPLNFLDKLKADSLVVLELSSFQLQDLTKSPQVAVVLRTTSEHLDYHKDVQEYREAKVPIVKYQTKDDAVIVNQDYDYADYYLNMTPARKFYVSFGELKGDGAHLGGPMIVNCNGSKCEMVMNSGKVALMGRHNLENVLPAVVAGRLLEAPIPAIQKVLMTFAGLPHRLEFVKEVNGVKYYNDSFSTTPETSIAAVYAFKGPVILIAGGSEKKSDFAEWATELQKCANLKNVILMGVTADRMEKALNDVAEKLKSGGPAGTIVGGEAASQARVGEPVGGQFPVKIYRAGSLQEALQEAQKGAAAGDNVVLSPACASFDMFKNYKERGEVFRKLVNEL